MMEPETVFLYIPNVAVGAIIGTKGSYIKNIIKLSGASVKITPLPAEETKTAPERQVVIVGMPDSQWKAQYYIYEKIRQERFATDDNVKLRAEIQVPAHIVGRIIGKSGKNVRELQRTTGATIKLPEDGSSSQHQQQQEGEGQVGEGVTATASATSQENEQAAGGEKETVAVANDESVKTSESNDAAGNAENAAEQSQEEKEKENTKSSSPDLSPNASNANVANGANSNFVTGIIHFFTQIRLKYIQKRYILKLDFCTLLKI
jgi:predicted PilT family ATPase